MHQADEQKLRLPFFLQRIGPVSFIGGPVLFFLGITERTKGGDDMKRKVSICLAMMCLVIVQAVRVWGIDMIKALPPATQQLTLEMIRTATKAPGSPSPGALVPVTGRGPNGKLVQGTGQIPWAAIAIMLAGAGVWVWDNWDNLVAVKDYFTLADIRKNPATQSAFTKSGPSYLGSSTNATCTSNMPGYGTPSQTHAYDAASYTDSQVMSAAIAYCGGPYPQLNYGMPSSGQNASYTWAQWTCSANSTHPGEQFYKVSAKPGSPTCVLSAQPGTQVAADVAAIVAALQTYGAASSANQDAMIRALNEMTANMVAQTAGQPATSTPNVTTGINDTPVPTGYSFPGSPTTAGENFVYQWYINAPTTYTDITNQAGDTTVTNIIPETDTSWLSKLLEWFRNAIGLGEAPPDGGGIPPTDHGADEGDPTPNENEKQIQLIPDDPDPDAEPMGPSRSAVQTKQNTFLANLLGELLDLTDGFRTQVSGLISGIGNGSSQCSMTAEVFGVSVPVNFCTINFGSIAPIITTMFCIACFLIIIGG